VTKIVLVEDDAWLADLEIEVLTNAGFSVTHSPHALSAIERIDSNAPDVLIVDVLLTGTTGLALLHELQSYVDTKAIPVIVCTNLAESLSIADLQAYGVRKIVDKTTMHPNDLVAAVRAVLL
jgi:DNA-binding response OmpR family regulator